MVVNAGPTVATAPPLSAPPFSLLSAATVVDHEAPPDSASSDDERRTWVNGLRWSPENEGTLTVWAPTCEPATLQGEEKERGRNRRAPVAYRPFQAIALDACGTWGWAGAEYEARARRALQAKEAAAVEAELWAGVLQPTNRHLSMPGPTSTTLLGGAATPLRRALAALVQTIADAKVGRGLIHARPRLVEMWGAVGAVVERNGKLVTTTGHFVVPGSGYLGTGPGDEAPTDTTEWAYATEAMIVDRGPVEVVPEGEDEMDRMLTATDPATNDVEVRAERWFAIRWSGAVHAAVNVNLAAE